jgi:Cu-Zn family superoxide dismutase
MKKMLLKSILAVSCSVVVMAAAGFAGAQDTSGAQTTLQGTDGRDLGTINFTQGPNGLLLKADLKDLPAGTLAFHLHSTGSCNPDFMAAGGHLNPTGKKHGFMHADGPHLGDMPNIHVPDSGKLQFELFLADMTIKAGPSPLLDEDGTTVMIHEGADDYLSDPAGAAGSRIACGVIEGK